MNRAAYIASLPADLRVAIEAVDAINYSDALAKAEAVGRLMAFARFAVNTLEQLDAEWWRDHRNLARLARELPDAESVFDLLSRPWKFSPEWEHLTRQPRQPHAPCALCDGEAIQ